MRPSDFSADASGRLIHDRSGFYAFVPSPLPPALDAGWDLTADAVKAHSALAELAGVIRTLPNPHLLISPFIHREAVLSSRIEGTQASLSDLLIFEAVPTAGERPPDVREVANYVRALEYGLARLAKLPVSLRLVREIHEHLMRGVRGEHLTPGAFRRSQNWIGPPGSTLAKATYVPPPVPEMRAALDAFEKYIHARSPLPPLVRLALIHYQFEAIHPFLDGNGRVGRLLITLLLAAWQLLPAPALYLSAFFERTRPQYYARLLAVTQRGAWQAWIEYFLEGVRVQAVDAITRSDHLIALRQTYRKNLQAGRGSALLLQLVDELFATPALSVPRVAKLLGVTQRAAQMSIHKLEDAGILKEATGRRRNRVFVAPEILRILETD